MEPYFYCPMQKSYTTVCADLAHSTVLTSGTLAPLEGFASEVCGYSVCSTCKLLLGSRIIREWLDRMHRKLVISPTQKLMMLSVPPQFWL